MNAAIVQNSLWSDKHGLLILKASGFAETYRAGRMCMLSVTGQSLICDPLLRRPFAPYDTDISENTLSVIYTVCGRGTLLLSQQPVGTALSLSLPQGKPFTVLKNSKAALIAGGAGIGPMHFLAKTLYKNGCDVTVFYGARTAGELYPPLRKTPSPYRWVLCTEDGSLGYKGVVTTFFAEEVASFDICYACGPKPMMQTVQTLCAGNNKPLELSLEETMACGIGVCSGCMVKISDNGVEKMKRCCAEGPVFNGNSVIW
ncbi:MAG: dihydroorotate dehydrogenase electron transfer subunit [Deferribacteraceae bacterium]|jgi:dihydroorotate dehydrogenase electron transfer subunit|nr:dihydroorotate dehydrogenase electron transfer subunit [Deferribacteraceae bacterium]